MSALPLSEDQLVGVYRDLHVNPELSFRESRTAGVVADRLVGWGYEVATGVGRTGVVGVLHNGRGPTALLRADMDALPVLEDTGLEYASTARSVDRSGSEVPVMHACGHDVHVACLLGAAAQLAADRSLFSGTLMLVFQPAEEFGTGARAMVEAGLFERFGRPDVLLGQHVSPLPAGLLGLHPGVAYSARDSLVVTLHGRGGHSSRPESSVDPVVMAAAAVMRLQTIVSREIGASEAAVVTVGSVHAGTEANIIPDDAVLRLSVRTFDPGVRERTLAAITRMVRAEAEASGALKPPTIDHTDYVPPVVNDEAAAARTRAAFEQWLGTGRVIDPGATVGSEDIGVLAEAAGSPCVYWHLGSGDPAAFTGAHSPDELLQVVRRLPTLHSPRFAPVVSPTLRLGVDALVTATSAWLPFASSEQR